MQGNIDKSEVMKELGAVALSVGGCSTLKPEVNNKRDVELNSTIEDEADYPLNKRHFIGMKEDHQPMISINMNFSGASLSAPLSFFGQNLSDLIAAVTMYFFVFFLSIL